MKQVLFGGLVPTDTGHDGEDVLTFEAAEVDDIVEHEFSMASEAMKLEEMVSTIESGEDALTELVALHDKVTSTEDMGEEELIATNESFNNICSSIGLSAEANTGMSDAIAKTTKAIETAIGEIIAKLKKLYTDIVVVTNTDLKRAKGFLKAFRENPKGEVMSTLTLGDLIQGHLYRDLAAMYQFIGGAKSVNLIDFVLSIDTDAITPTLGNVGGDNMYDVKFSGTKRTLDDGDNKFLKRPIEFAGNGFDLVAFNGACVGVFDPVESRYRKTRVNDFKIDLSKTVPSADKISKLYDKIDYNVKLIQKIYGSSEKMIATIKNDLKDLSGATDDSVKSKLKKIRSVSVANNAMTSDQIMGLVKLNKTMVRLIDHRKYRLPK